jgi:enoyl-CoA hydratase
MMRAVEKMPKPVIAMINGFALGGGLELAMCCHLRIAADTAKVGQPEINLGLIPGFGGSQRLLRLAGRAATLELCLLGTPIDATRALQLGIVNRVVAAAELETETMKLAEQLASAAPLALRGLLDCVNVGGECGIEEGLEYESAQFGLMFATDDMREGTTAFLERRKPVFVGR